MKRTCILVITVLFIALFGYSQSIENLEYVSPFHDGVSAIKKDGQWAFINKKGGITVPFRNDLFLTKMDDGNYPVFNNDRCLIVIKKEGITYFGYIDKLGKRVIDPQFLNATNFHNNVAIALKLVKKDIGRNEILGKNVVYYRSHEVTINKNGNIENYLDPKGVNVVLDKKFLKKPPQIKSKIISENLIATLSSNKKWTVKRINE